MGFRRTLRRRLKGVINSPQLDTKKPLPPSPTDPPQSHLAKPPEHITAVENLQRNVKPLTIYHSVVKPPASRTSLGGGVRSEPSVISSRTSLFDNASRLRRLFREKVLKKAEGSEASENEVPEYISEEELKEGDKDASVRNDEVLFPPFTPWIDGVIDAEVGKLLPVGLNAEGNEQVNDGFISFTVPDGWTACRKEDCFYLLKGLSVGYVRSVPSTGAANALLETNRLQIVSNVSVRTSPEYGSPRRICSAGKKREEVTSSPYLQVDYSSYFGMGKGWVMCTVYNLFQRNVTSIPY